MAAGAIWVGLPRRVSAATPEDSEQGAGWRSLVTVPLLAAYLIAFGDYLWIGFDLTLAPLWMRHHLGATITMIGVAYSVWALPSALLVPLGGRMADRYPRWLLILVFGLAQLPEYWLYVVSHSIVPVLFGFALQAAFYAFVSPAVDAHLAASSPPRWRGRIQSSYTAAGILGGLVGATVFVPLYAIDYRLPILGIAIGYGIVIVAGGAIIGLFVRRQSFAARSELTEEPPLAALN